MNRPARPAPAALAATFGSALAPSLALAHRPGPAPKGQTRCGGIAQAGADHGATLRGTQDQADPARQAFAIDGWKQGPAGTCKPLQGSDEAEARRRLKLPPG